MRPGHLVLLIAASLLALGVVMVHSASMDLSGTTTLSGLLLSRPTGLAVAAFACLLIGSRVPVERLGRARGAWSPAPWILLATFALLLAVHIPGVGREANGALRWIQIGPIGFQPSEVAKWGLPMAIACHAFQRASDMHRPITGFVIPLSIASLLCAIIAVSDLGTAILIMIVAVAMLVVAGARPIYPIVAAPVLLAGAALMVLTSPYRRNRILAYLDPFQDQAGIGYHIIQSMAAIHGGEITGRGLGNSIQKFGYLPESTTDFIFAIICEELGVVGAAVVVLLYIGLILAGLTIVLRAPSGQAPGAGTDRPTDPVSGLSARPGDFSRILGFGILMTLATQAAINLSVVTGLAPTKGIALPLVSHGGTGWLLTAFSLGLLVSIDRASAGVEPTRALQPAVMHEDDEGARGLTGDSRQPIPSA